VEKSCIGIVRDVQIVEQDFLMQLERLPCYQNIKKANPSEIFQLHGRMIEKCSKYIK